jgi:YcxB-like protein
MKLEYQLDENDYLQHQLYTASKTERIKKQRIKSWIFVSLTFFLISLLFLKNEDKSTFYIFIMVGIITLIFYPYYLRNHYKNHYLKFIKDTYKNRFGKMSIIEFFDEEIVTNDSDSESKVKYSALDEFNEIDGHIFLKLKTSGSFIIPKLKIENLENLKSELKNIAEKYNIKQNVELEWKWK